MSQISLSDLAERMRDIDFCMLSTRTDGDVIAARPMSNNRDVAYDGDSHFFADEQARSVADIGRDPNVSLSFQGKAGLLGKPPVFIAVEGRAEVIRDKAEFAAHWVPDLERWFTDGIDTPGLVLLRVSARRVHVWNGEDEGEVPL